MLNDTNFSNEGLLNRICQVYGFSQKIQLAKHFDIAASSLQNRYTRGNISYDFAVHCALETGTNIKWLMTGEGPQREGAISVTGPLLVESFTLSDGKLIENTKMSIDKQFFNKELSNGFCVKSDGKLYFIDKNPALSDGLWLVDIEGISSIRDLTMLPRKKLHVAGGKVPFECGIDEIKTLGRVVGVYSEVN